MTDDAMQQLARAQVHDVPDVPDVPGDPTPAGATPAVRLVEVTDVPLDLAAHERAATQRTAGAHVVFQGIVRDHDHGRRVVELEYEGHPSAGRVLAEIAAEFEAEPDVLALAVSHRVGKLVIGDVALVAVVATAHRRQAFELCARLVDEVKDRLPIWKRQVFDDGTDEWVNCP